MYIDDEEELTRFIGFALRRSGHEVRTYLKPAEALDALRQAPHDFDLVVTDATMPAVSGVEVARAVSQLRPSLPVILVSGDLSPDLIQEAENAGVARVLQKPFRVSDLLARENHSTSGLPHHRPAPD